jgi:hypothetical protein
MPNNARLYAELMRKSCGGSYANWNPPQSIEVGDYGIVDKETTSFEKEGNIFDPGFCPELDIARNYPVKLSKPNDMEIFMSRGVKRVGFDSAIAAKYPLLVDSKVKVCCDFSKGRGASLVLYMPKQSYIDRVGDLMPKLQHNETLAEKALVTSVFSCPMYSLLLKDEKDTSGEVAIGLSLFDTPDLGAHSRAQWHHYNVSGVVKTGGESANSTFYPLYSLRTPKTRSWMDTVLGRRRGRDPEGEDTFYNYQPPWGPLDDQGDECFDGSDDEED